MSIESFLEIAKGPHITQAQRLTQKLNDKGFHAKALDQYLVVLRGAVFIYTNSKNKNIRASKTRAGPYLKIQEKDIIKSIIELGAEHIDNIVYLEEHQR